ncbi:MAG: 4Fe-4S dicluster domain-containing protein [Gracilibacteraceae bacterium]|nr:4Fe-4S dicluster domain-containing protein [Gracilibacteraceae bacterium]
MSEYLSIEERLGLDKFNVDEGEAHIVLLREAVCAACLSKPCTFVCPAGLYKWAEGKMSFNYVGCLECGTCRVACPSSEQALTWRYPRGSYGVSFRCS